jgi:pimeloyl-ACP methyl ester carboxylesterase
LLARVSNLDVPVLLMGGGKDELVAPDSVRRLFDAIPASDSKTYVFLPFGHHLTFIDHCLGCTDALPEARGHELTNRFVTAFLETYVVGDARYREYLSDVPPDASVVR